MESGSDAASFTFSWRALKLLGSGLYSNPWSALSELVANGLDAGASEVYVYVDARDKAHAVVEVIDNGTGMSRADIDTYVKVGHNKREAIHRPGEDAHPKGRKGIGKLAALFLSPHFFLSTRHSEGATSWELDARDGQVVEDERPRLLSVSSVPTTANDDLWSSLHSGTRLTMLDVDLRGYGAQAISALGARLANQFLLPVNADPRVLLWVQHDESEVRPSYQQVEKNIAFRNLAFVARSFPDPGLCPPELERASHELMIPARGLPGGVYHHVPRFTQLGAAPVEDEAWGEIAEEVDSQNRTYKGFRYDLTGWIGVHATIKNDAAKSNDPRFAKNKYYNPAEIRVYVRGKLASDRLLTQLGLTGTYVNYVEGELTFDLLDEDDLPDISTSNRQDFDETDKRVTLLRALVRPIVRKLIQDRNNLASEISSKAKELEDQRATAGKLNFTKQLRADLDSYDEISEATRSELEMVISNKIQGEVAPKRSYRLFISHASADKMFASLVDDLLRSRGARSDEIFFTSRRGAVDVLLDDRSLSEVVKRNITDDNTLLFYLTSKNFLASQFCLFEAGAGWATRAVSDYLRLNIDYGSIPKWLTNGKGEVTLLSGGNIELTPELHNYLVRGVLNPMIEHLNLGRSLSEDASIPLFSEAVFPTAKEMAQEGKVVEDYFCAEIVAHWNAVVRDGVSKYVESYLTK